MNHAYLFLTTLANCKKRHIVSGCCPEQLLGSHGYIEKEEVASTKFLLVDISYDIVFHHGHSRLCCVCILVCVCVCVCVCPGLCPQPRHTHGHHIQAVCFFIMGCNNVQHHSHSLGHIRDHFYTNPITLTHHG